MAIPSRQTINTAWTSSGAAGSPLNVPRPAGITAGDLMIVAHEGQGTNITTAPTGWTRLVNQTLNSSSRFNVWARRYLGDANDPSGGYDFVSDGGNIQTAQVAVLRTAVDVGSLIIGTPAVRSGSIGVTTFPSITVPANTLVLGFGGESSSAGGDVVSAPTNCTLWAFTGEPSAGIVRTMATVYKDMSAGGASGDMTLTYSNASAAGVGVQIGIPYAAVAPTVAYTLIGTATPGKLGVGAKVFNSALVHAVANLTGGGPDIVGASVAPAASGYVHALVTGLAAGTEYTLKLIDDSTSTILDTLYGKTLSGSTPTNFVAGTSSCQQNNAVASLYTQVAVDNLDFFVHQGDLHYKDATVEADWIDGMDSSFSGTNMKSFLKSTTFLYGWDNHDWGGNQSWRDSPAKNWAPARIRELMGTATYPDAVGTYETWVHGGIRFIQTDQWSLRDYGQDGDDFRVGKTMLGLTQRQWLFDTLTSATEKLIVWLPSFPLYGNFVGNGRWGNFRDEASIIQSFWDAHPEIKAKTVCVGGDSHNVVADTGSNTMWGLPSLNASPIDRNGDPGGLPSGTWNICNLERGVNSGYYSRLSFTWTSGRPSMLWEAVRDDAVVVASYTFTPPPTDPIVSSATVVRAKTSLTVNAAILNSVGAHLEVVAVDQTTVPNSILTPNVSDGPSWGARGFGTSGTGTKSYGNVDGTIPAPGTSFGRKTWTAAPSTNEATGFDYRLGAFDQRIAAQPGDLWQIKGAMRSNLAGKKLQARLTFENASLVIVNLPIDGAMLDSFAADWRTVSVQGLAPAGTVYLRPLLDVRNGGALVWAIGDTLDATNAICQRIGKIGSTVAPSGGTVSLVADNLWPGVQYSVILKDDASGSVLWSTTVSTLADGVRPTWFGDYAFFSTYSMLTPTWRYSLNDHKRAFYLQTVGNYGLSIEDLERLWLFTQVAGTTRDSNDDLWAKLKAL